MTRPGLETRYTTLEESTLTGGVMVSVLSSSVVYLVSSPGRVIPKAMKIVSFLRYGKQH
jgi:hypothetical protein